MHWPPYAVPWVVSMTVRERKRWIKGTCLQQASGPVVRYLCRTAKCSDPSCIVPELQEQLYIFIALLRESMIYVAL